MGDLSILVGLVVDERHRIEPGNFGFCLTMDGYEANINSDVFPLIGFMVFNLAENKEEFIDLYDKNLDFKMKNVLVLKSFYNYDLLKWSHAGLGAIIKYRDGMYSIINVRNPYRLYNQEYKLFGDEYYNNFLSLPFIVDGIKVDMIYRYDTKEIEINLGNISTKTLELVESHYIEFDNLNSTNELLDYLGVTDEEHYFSINNVYRNKRTNDSSLVLPACCRCLVFNINANNKITNVVVPPSCELVALTISSFTKDMDIKIHYKNPDIKVYNNGSKLCLNYAKKWHNLEFIRY
mgnify:CR=1 FL=1